MNRNFEDNVKVYFAGAEQLMQGAMAIEAGVKYTLWTVFPFISEKVGIKPYPNYGIKHTPYIPKYLENWSRSTIMDSGVFTLMFGAHAGKRDKKFMYTWFDNLCEFVDSNKLKSICVEVDCQKVLGTEEAWYLREKMRTALPKNRIINVFHIEDGNEGLDRMIEFSDYIAVSVPELRIVRRGTYKRDVDKLTRYIKNKKPSIDIHLLGCTDINILRRNRFCTSADSTSWKAPLRYGYYEGRKINDVKQEKHEEYKERIVKRLEHAGTPNYTENLLRANINIFITALLCKEKYERAVGSQE